MLLPAVGSAGPLAEAGEAEKTDPRSSLAETLGGVMADAGLSRMALWVLLTRSLLSTVHQESAHPPCTPTLPHAIPRIPGKDGKDGSTQVKAGLPRKLAVPVPS